MERNLQTRLHVYIFIVNTCTGTFIYMYGDYVCFSPPVLFLSTVFHWSAMHMIRKKETLIAIPVHIYHIIPSTKYMPWLSIDIYDL